MRFRRGLNGYYLVFKNETEADKYAFLGKLFYRACFDGYMNAYAVFESYNSKEAPDKTDYPIIELCLAQHTYNIIVQKLRDDWESHKRTYGIYFETTGALRRFTEIGDEGLRDLCKQSKRV